MPSLGETVNYLVARDVFSEIAQNEKSVLPRRSLKGKAYDYATYALALGRRFAELPAFGLSIEETVQGRYIAGLWLFAAGVFAHGKSPLEKSKNFLDYVLVTDVRQYFKAYEGAIEEYRPRTKASKAADYWLHINMALPRFTLLVTEMDGIRRILEGDTKTGNLELILGVFGHALDYRSRHRRLFWIRYFEDNKKMKAELAKLKDREEK